MLERVKKIEELEELMLYFCGGVSP